MADSAAEGTGEFRADEEHHRPPTDVRAIAHNHWRGSRQADGIQEPWALAGGIGVIKRISRSLTQPEQSAQ